MTSVVPTQLPMDQMFNRKKWSVFILSVITLIETIICTIVMNNLMNGYYYYYRIIGMFRVIWVVGGIIGCVTQLIGMLGAYKANFAMVLCHAMLCTGLSAVFLYVGCNTGDGVWASFVLYLVLAFLSYSFARDIRRRRVGLLTNHVISQNQTQTTQIYMPGSMPYQPQTGQVNYGYAQGQGYPGSYPAQMQMPPQNAYVNPGFTGGQSYVPQQLYTTQPNPHNQSFPSYGNDHDAFYANASQSNMTGAQPPPYSAEQGGSSSSTDTSAPNNPNYPDNSAWNMGKF